jgi:hypothetical protein
MGRNADERVKCRRALNKSVVLSSLLLALFALVVGRCVAADNLYYPKKVAKAKYFCIWLRKEMSKYSPPAYCSANHGDLNDPAAAFGQITEFWQSVRAKSMADSFTKPDEFDAAVDAYFSEQHPEFMLKEGERIEDLPTEKLRHVGISALCNEHSVRQLAAPHDKVMAEIRRRQAFTPREVSAIEKSTVFLGMSESAMLCSLGPDGVAHRTVGSWGVHTQYVYKGITVYTENGKLTSWQD